MLTLTELRDVIVDALKTRNILTIGERVFSSRTENAWAEEGNFICVYTNSNKFDDGDRSPVVYRVTSDVIIDVVVQGENSFNLNGENRVMGVADQMDYITQKVLDALVMAKTDSNLYRNLPFKKVRVDSIQNTLAGQGEMDKGTQRISLVYTWYVELPMLGVPEDEFLLAHTRIELGEQTKIYELADKEGNLIADKDDEVFAFVEKTSSGLDLEFDSKTRNRK